MVALNSSRGRPEWPAVPRVTAPHRRRPAWSSLLRRTLRCAAGCRPASGPERRSCCAGTRRPRRSDGRPPSRKRPSRRRRR
ncbi:MAG: hypothetical protein EON87_22220 [Brevundimonas sp.]|nr:MAG: hypothetical protein EON87_22220 [Brevundimonas sp.]